MQRTTQTAGHSEGRERSQPPGIQHRTVREAMHPGILTSAPDASLEEVARTMARHRVHCVAVLGIDEHAGPHLVWGIVSDLDVIRATLTGGSEAPTAGRIAATEPVTIDAGESLAGAAQLMVEHDVHHLVVVDGEDPQPVGILSCLDVAEAIAAQGS